MHRMVESSCLFHARPSRFGSLVRSLVLFLSVVDPVLWVVGHLCVGFLASVVLFVFLVLG